MIFSERFVQRHIYNDQCAARHLITLMRPYKSSNLTANADQHIAFKDKSIISSLNGNVLLLKMPIYYPNQVKTMNCASI